MTKYVKVKEAPEDLNKGEIIIEAPNFIEEIGMCARRAPKNHYTTSNYMRDIAAAIGDKYMREDFNALMTINTSRFRGIPFETAVDVDKIVRDMLLKSVPQVFEAYVDHYVRNRPPNTKLIYFLGDHLHTGPFTTNGIDEINSKEIDTYLGKKPKKVIGKPAIKSKDMV